MGKDIIFLILPVFSSHLSSFAEHAIPSVNQPERPSSKSFRLRSSHRFHPDRCDQLAIGADKGIVPDNRPVLVGTVIIAGDCPRTDIDPASDSRVSDIGKMVRLALRRNMAVLDLNKIADMHFLSQLGSRPQACIRSDQRSPDRFSRHPDDRKDGFRHFPR